MIEVYGGSTVRKTDKALHMGDDVVAFTRDLTERVKEILGSGKGGSILLYVCTNNANNCQS